MRIFFVGFLLAGLVVIGVSAYDAAVTAPSDETAVGVAICEDGTPIPQPSPTPRNLPGTR